jgi:hypothetical protein
MWLLFRYFERAALKWGPTSAAGFPAYGLGRSNGLRCGRLVAPLSKDHRPAATLDVLERDEVIQPDAFRGLGPGTLAGVG